MKYLHANGIFMPSTWLRCWLAMVFAYVLLVRDNIRHYRGLGFMQSVVPLLGPNTSEFCERGYSIQLLFESRSVFFFCGQDYKVRSNFFIYLAAPLYRNSVIYSASV